MPWDGTELHLARLDAAGAPADDRLIAGARDVSVFQPQWSPDGRLYYVSDATGWWNLYRFEEQGTRNKEQAAPMPRPSGRGTDTPTPLIPLAAEFGQPLWQFGASTYAFDGPGRIVCTYCVAGSWRLATIDTRTNALTDIDTPYTRVNELTARDGRALFFGASPDAPAGIVALDLATGKHEVLKRTSTIDIDPATISHPQTIEFPTTGDTTAFAFYYPPRNAAYPDTAHPEALEGRARGPRMPKFVRPEPVEGRESAPKRGVLDPLVLRPSKDEPPPFMAHAPASAIRYRHVRLAPKAPRPGRLHSRRCLGTVASNRRKQRNRTVRAASWCYEWPRPEPCDSTRAIMPIIGRSPDPTFA
jgi:hypothetical protein